MLSPYEGAEDLNSPTAVQLDGVLFIEGEGRPAEIDHLIRDLRNVAEEPKATGEWLTTAMESSWAVAVALIEIDGLADMLGERHRIIANDWQAAAMNAVMSHLLDRSADILEHVDFTPPRCVPTSLRGELSIGLTLLRGGDDLPRRRPVQRLRRPGARERAPLADLPPPRRRGPGSAGVAVTHVDESIRQATRARAEPGSRTRLLAAGFASLGGLIVVYVLLGPLLLERIHFSTSTSGLNQIRGGDLAALCVVAPVCFAVAALAWRGHPAAPALGLAPAGFAMYTYSQLILGNEYLDRPGNVERFFPLLLALFVVAARTLRSVLDGNAHRQPARHVPAAGARERHPPAADGVLRRRRNPPALARRGHAPASCGPSYLQTPNTFWTVKFYDLGIVVPAAVTVGIGLLRRYTWAKKPAYAILGGYVLLACSVAGMAWTMLANGDPDGSWVQAIAMTCFAGAGVVFAVFLYRPLFDRPA